MKIKFTLLISFSAAFITAGIFLLSLYAFQTDSRVRSGGPMQPDEWLYQQKAFPYNITDRAAQKNAARYTLEQKRKNASGSREDNDWHFAGPLMIGGRIQDIEVPSGSQTTIFVGTASGGVLRSYDGGDSWQNIFDDNESLSIGDIAIDPVDTSIIYVGTGEPNCGGGSLTYDGNGIYKSLDGGDTWNNIGLTDMGNTGKIAIDPTNSQIIFAAMMGDLFSNGPDRGLYRSTDGGASWDNVLFVSDSTGAIDVAINPIDPDIIYVSMWERVRRFNRHDYTGTTSRIYRSTDGGDTWDMLTSGLPTGQLCKISLALCASEPETIYACIDGSSEALLDIYKTTDGGDNWTDLNASDELSSVSYDYWYGGVKVDPNDPDKVYYIGYTCDRSTNGGLSWNGFAGSAHVDHHALYISPVDNNFKILGNDGGLNFTHNDFATYTTAQNIPVTQIYDMDVLNSDTSYIIAGAQDNFNSIKESGTNNWFTVNGGDGVSNIFLQTNEESYFANYQYGGYYGIVDGFYVPLSGLDFGDRFIWRSPVAVNPLDPQTIYVAGTKVYRSNNSGNSVHVISDDLTNGPGPSPFVVYGCISTIHNAVADTNYIYIGCDDGNVWRSKNYGDDWEKISDALPERFVTAIETDPNDAEVVYITFSGYRWADDAAHVYRSEDAGDTWENIEGDLPDIPVNKIVVYPINDSLYLYAANDAGVYVSYNEGLEWTLLGSKMPVVSVYDLVLHTETNTLFAGTFGRGIYKINLPSAPKPIAVNDITSWDLSIYPNPVRDNINIHFSESADADIIIYDLAGNAVYQDKIAGADAVIDMRSLPAGSYLVSIETNDIKRVQKITKI